MSDENISSADDAGDGAAFRAPASTLTRWFARMFLPEDYPNSVSDDYAAFQAWDTAQGLCSYVRGSLTTKALLEGVGVGATGATAASAAAQFIARDMCGMVGGLVFTLAKGRHLDAEAKQWRLFADLANNVGMAMELAAPLANDRGWFLALACAGSVARSLCGCAAGATRAALTQHFARARNAADIAAKEGSQETAVTLVGMTLGVAVTTTTDGKTAWQWAVFVALTVAHVYCNVRAVRSLVIDSLNRERVRRLLARYDETLDEPSARGSDKVSAENSPRGLAKDEALLPVGMNWMLWPWYRYRGAREVRSVHLGAPVGSATREETIDLLRRLRDDGPADSASGHRPRGGRKVTEGMEGEELAEQLESMGVTAEPKNFVRKTVEVEDDGAEAPKELTEEERKEIIAKIELEKAHAKEAELKAKADVSPFHVDDEGWYDEDEDPFELLKLVAGNKRAVIMPKGHVETEEMET